MQSIKKKPTQRAGFEIFCKTRLTFGELRCTTCFFETVFFTFFHSGVTGKETGFFENGSEFFVVLKKSTGKAVTDCACLAGYAAACNGANDVECADGFGEFHGLTNDEFKGIKAEIFVDVAAVDGDCASAVRINANTSYRAFSSAGTVEVGVRIIHSLRSPFDYFTQASGA